MCEGVSTVASARQRVVALEKCAVTICVKNNLGYHLFLPLALHTNTFSLFF